MHGYSSSMSCINLTTGPLKTKGFIDYLTPFFLNRANLLNITRCELLSPFLFPLKSMGRGEQKKPKKPKPNPNRKPKKPNRKNRPKLKTDGSVFTFSITEKFGSVSVFV